MLLQCEDVAVAQRLAPFTASVDKGELIHLLGPNGAGKSSLLAALAGLLPAEGRIVFNGTSLSAWNGYALARHRAYLAQQQRPPGSMPVWHYLKQHQLVDEGDRILITLCETFQLADKLARSLNRLSGGEWQRVRLVAVLCQTAQPEGQLLLLDEPLTGLDLAQQAAFDRCVAARVAEGLTIIMSGHDINHSLHHARRIWLLQEGVLVRQGATEEVLRPETLSAVYHVPFRKIDVEGQSLLTTLF
ncbi:vitamin B12 ABC transporter ATP-binding protein BtuD [Erwinia sp. BC051422]|uniref:vitamin B12 ABC transporter ATP-binding protein BtuD n=1 Tax=Erwinia wuhanensis TaxID=3045167 RepID=UPI002655028D|nr:vitamin B12 ABC transporter ATP-binding protein BtuD [Erwinia sp. BC051422]MDN8540543.1 vitamin B12 ABC transporter ATP-binding protein BtuD [Erwinia sp. BC051422]